MADVDADGVEARDRDDDGESPRSVVKNKAHRLDPMSSFHYEISHIPLAGVRPLKLAILSKRLIPSSLPRASRRSRRRRADFCAADSSDVDIS